MDMWGDVKAVLVVLPVVVGVLTVLMAGLAWKIHGEFEWEIYRAIAGDSGMKRRFLTYQVGYHSHILFPFWLSTEADCLRSTSCC